jgi:hypothetical protein
MCSAKDMSDLKNDIFNNCYYVLLNKGDIDKKSKSFTPQNVVNVERTALHEKRSGMNIVMQPRLSRVIYKNDEKNDKRMKEMNEEKEKIKLLNERYKILNEKSRYLRANNPLFDIQLVNYVIARHSTPDRYAQIQKQLLDKIPIIDFTRTENDLYRSYLSEIYQTNKLTEDSDVEAKNMAMKEFLKTKMGMKGGGDDDINERINQYNMNDDDEDEQIQEEEEKKEKMNELNEKIIAQEKQNSEVEIRELSKENTVVHNDDGCYIFIFKLDINENNKYNNKHVFDNLCVGNFVGEGDKVYYVNDAETWSGAIFNILGYVKSEGIIKRMKTTNEGITTCFIQPKDSGSIVEKDIKLVRPISEPHPIKYLNGIIIKLDDLKTMIKDGFRSSESIINNELETHKYNYDMNSEILIKLLEKSKNDNSLDRLLFLLANKINYNILGNTTSTQLNRSARDAQQLGNKIPDTIENDIPTSIYLNTFTKIMFNLIYPNLEPEKNLYKTAKLKFNQNDKCDIIYYNNNTILKDITIYENSYNEMLSPMTINNKKMKDFATIEQTYENAIRFILLYFSSPSSGNYIGCQIKSYYNAFTTKLLTLMSITKQRKLDSFREIIKQVNGTNIITDAAKKMYKTYNAEQKKREVEIKEQKQKAKAEAEKAKAEKAKAEIAKAETEKAKAEAEERAKAAEIAMKEHNKFIKATERANAKRKTKAQAKAGPQIEASQTEAQPPQIKASQTEPQTNAESEAQPPQIKAPQSEAQPPQIKASQTEPQTNAGPQIKASQTEPQTNAGPQIEATIGGKKSKKIKTKKNYRKYKKNNYSKKW